MPRSFAHLCLLVLIACLGACGSSNNSGGAGGTGGTGGTGGGTATVVPKKAPIGDPTGAPAVTTIGPEGGLLASDDGRFEVDIPAGAVATATEFSVTAIENTAGGGVGTAYRVLPSVQLAKAASVRFYYDDADEAGSLPEAFNITFQDENDFWRIVQKPVVDEFDGTVSVQTHHFTDWSLIHVFELSPAKASLKPGENLQFVLVWCDTAPVQGSSGDLLAPLFYDCGTDLKPLGAKLEWSASAGTVTDAGAFTAPASAPTPNPAIVTLRVNYDGKLWILLAEVLISEAGAYTGVINHESVNPGHAFKARVDMELYLESQDETAFYAARGTITILTDVDIGTHSCSLAKPTSSFDTTTTTMLALSKSGTYTFNYVLTHSSSATCKPKDPKDSEYTIDDLPVGLALMPNCNPLTPFTVTDPALLKDSAQDLTCGQSKADWEFKQP